MGAPYFDRKALLSLLSFRINNSSIKIIHPYFMKQDFIFSHPNMQEIYNKTDFLRIIVLVDTIKFPYIDEPFFQVMGLLGSWRETISQFGRCLRVGEIVPDNYSEFDQPHKQLLVWRFRRLIFNQAANIKYGKEYCLLLVEYKTNIKLLLVPGYSGRHGVLLKPVNNFFSSKTILNDLPNTLVKFSLKPNDYTFIHNSFLDPNKLEIASYLNIHCLFKSAYSSCETKTKLISMNYKTNEKKCTQTQVSCSDRALSENTILYVYELAKLNGNNNLKFGNFINSNIKNFSDRFIDNLNYTEKEHLDEELVLKSLKSKIDISIRSMITDTIILENSTSKTESKLDDESASILFINFWNYCLKICGNIKKLNGYDLKTSLYKKINKIQKKTLKLIKVNKSELCGLNWYFDGTIIIFFSKQLVQTVFSNECYF